MLYPTDLADGRHAGIQALQDVGSDGAADGVPGVRNRPAITRVTQTGTRPWV